MDFKAEPISLERLRQTYDPITAGRGNFERNAVRVVYIHENSQYNFIWQPRA